MEVGSREEAECLTFRQHVGGDTLDAFAPLSHYTHRVHNDKMESTWTKVSRSITYPDGTVDWGIKEKDYIPEATRLLSTKVENPLARREQFAVDQRKSRNMTRLHKSASYTAAKPRWKGPFLPCSVGGTKLLSSMEKLTRRRKPVSTFLKLSPTG